VPRRRLPLGRLARLAYAIAHARLLRGFYPVDPAEDRVNFEEETREAL